MNCFEIQGLHARSGQWVTLTVLEGIDVDEAKSTIKGLSPDCAHLRTDHWEHMLNVCYDPDAFDGFRYVRPA